jgi:hypothetical protein
MEMIQVINGEIKQYSLPKTGILKDGSTVSGYHLLDEEILKEEGWLPLEDNSPEYDRETQYLINDGYEILEDKVIKKYKIEDIPEPTEPEPSEMDLLKDEITELKQTIDIMLGGEIIE